MLKAKLLTLILPEDRRTLRIQRFTNYISYLPYFHHSHHRSNHRCYSGVQSSIIYITSYSYHWYEKMEKRNAMTSIKWENTIFEESLEEQHNLPYIIVITRKIYQIFVEHVK